MDVNIVKNGLGVIRRDLGFEKMCRWGKFWFWGNKGKTKVLVGELKKIMNEVLAWGGGGLGKFVPYLAV